MSNGLHIFDVYHRYILFVSETYLLVLYLEWEQQIIKQRGKFHSYIENKLLNEEKYWGIEDFEAMANNKPLQSQSDFS